MAREVPQPALEPITFDANPFILEKVDHSCFDPYNDPVLAALRSQKWILKAGPRFVGKSAVTSVGLATYTTRFEVNFHGPMTEAQAAQFLQAYGLELLKKTNDLLGNDREIEVRAPQGMGAGLNLLKKILEARPEVKSVWVSDFE